MSKTPDHRIVMEQLSAIVGLAHVRQERGRLHVHPASTSEVAAVLRLAHDHQLVLNPHGGGTKQDWLSQDHSLLSLRTDRLSQVLEHTWQDLTCTVQAGCLWSSLQEVLSRHGQFVALDPLWPDRCTVGGVVATNDSGSLRLRYGSLRDLVIGMTIVLPDGTVARSGGKVVKNVAGYDLHKLMTGAFGTLGIMTEITFRLHAIPAHLQSHTIASANCAALNSLLLGLLDSKLSIQAMQLRTNLDGARLDVQLAALPQVLEEQSHTLRELADAANFSLLDPADDVWKAREDLLIRRQDFIVKATMLPSHIASIATAIQGLGGSSVTQGTGIMIASVPALAAVELLEVRREIEQRQGSLIVLRQSPTTRAEPWGTPPDSLPLMRAIKQKFDPNGILNPGRSFGGI